MSNWASHLYSLKTDISDDYLWNDRIKVSDCRLNFYIDLFIRKTAQFMKFLDITNRYFYIVLILKTFIC